MGASLSLWLFIELNHNSDLFLVDGCHGLIIYNMNIGSTEALSSSLVY